MTTSEVLNQAADHMQVFGHRKFGLGRQGEPTCALGAIEVAEGQRVGPVMVAFYKYIREATGSGVASWNNAPDRTADEVIEALRACAVIEAAREHETVEVS